MTTHTLTLGNATFEVSNVTATRTSSYGHYKIQADVNGTTYTSIMDASYLYDDMYCDIDNDDDAERQANAEIAVARIIIRANQLV